jgi:type I restriction enzyme S subunit
VLRVADFLSERKQKGIEGLPIYSVLMEGGMVPRNTVERRVPSELESNDNRLVKHGDLAYNMMRMWQGASGIAAVDCLVSPAYVVCTPSDIIDSDFLGYLLKNPASIQMLRRYSQGLTGDRLRLYFEHFKLMSFAIPPIEEQRRIGNMLKSVDESITKKSLQLSAQQTLKRALMQSLLTGKVRVNVSKQETAAA